MKFGELLFFVLFSFLKISECKLVGDIDQGNSIVHALIQRFSFMKNVKQGDSSECLLQTAYDCLVKCDCSTKSRQCKSGESCMYICFLFSKPKEHCLPDLYKEKTVLNILVSNNKSSRNSTDDCHKRCPWSKYCDQCPNCKWCWLCSSCSVPSTNCKYCRVCKGAASSCAKCCGY